MAKGPIPPSVWQAAHFFSRIGATSLGIGDRCDLAPLGEVDQATRAHLAGGQGLATGQGGLDRVGGPGVLGVGLLAAVVQPVVQRTAVGDLPGLGVDHEELGRAGDAKLLADQLVGVLQDRDVDPVLGLLLGDGLHAVLHGGVHHQELDALALVLRLKGLQRGAEVAHDGAAVGVADKHDNLGVGPIELVAHVLGVGQHEVVDGGGRRRLRRLDRRDRCARRQRVGGRSVGCAAEQQAAHGHGCRQGGNARLRHRNAPPTGHGGG